jgi:hypothetical protein
MRARLARYTRARASWATLGRAGQHSMGGGGSRVRVRGLVLLVNRLFKKIGNCACLLAASTMILLLGYKAKILLIGGMDAAKKWAFLITFI